MAPDKENLRNPFLFVVGCPRSGTTLLQRMLDNHHLLGVANDTHFIPRCLEKFAPHLVGRAIAGEAVPLTEELVAGVRSYRRFGRLGLGDADVEEAERRSGSYSEFVTVLYDRFARRVDKPLVGEKTPDYVRRLPLLHGLFPEARVIHIVRDGRDVTLSALDWSGGTKGPGKMELWKTEPLAVCALWWRWQVRLGRDAADMLGPARYIEVRYEELVENPESTLRRLSAFLGLSYSAEMLTYYVGKERSEPGLSAKSAWLPPTLGLRDWRTQMTERDVGLFDALAGDLLEELGLERPTVNVSPETTQVASYCRSWWAAMLARREAKATRRVRAAMG